MRSPHAATATTSPYVACIGFMDSIDNSTLCGVTLYTNNGNDDTESIQSASDDESSDFDLIQLASDFGSDDD
jgi:hypothetical protein